MPLPVDYPIIDADGHVVELDDEIKQYLPARYRQIEDNREYGLFPMEGWSFGTTDRHKQDVPTAEDWLSFLDEAGIAATVLYPSNALNHGLMRHTRWAIDVARAYNDWLYDRFARHAPRLNGVALLPLQDVDAAVAELRRCVRDYGFVGGYVTTVTAPLSALGNPEFDSLYAAAQELDTMLAVHGGAVGGHTFGEPLRRWREVRAVKHIIPQLIQVTSMISGGVFDRFPDLRVAYLEAGSGWVLCLLDLLDEQFERKGADDLRRKPSEYLQGDNVYFSFEIEERVLPWVIEAVGAHKLVWPSDYPHERPRAQFFDDLPAFFARQDITDEARRLILCDNPRRLYRLKVPAAAR